MDVEGGGRRWRDGNESNALGFRPYAVAAVRVRRPQLPLDLLDDGDELEEGGVTTWSAGNGEKLLQWRRRCELRFPKP